MKVLVGCEFSGIVRDAFISRGHEAISCDLEPTWKPGPHLQECILKVIAREQFDLAIFHPPCTDLAVSGRGSFKYKAVEQETALNFVRLLLAAPIERICLENPVSIISTRIKRPTQIIQPWMFGHGEDKLTCLWLKNLPRLRPTRYIKRGFHYSRVQSIGEQKDRAKMRSITYTGIASAMAEQWG